VLTQQDPPGNPDSVGVKDILVHANHSNAIELGKSGCLRSCGAKCPF
jgi:hypothetical protein